MIWCAEEDYSKALLEIYERETPVISHLLDEIDKEGAIYDKATADTPGEEDGSQKKKMVMVHTSVPLELVVRT